MRIDPLDSRPVSLQNELDLTVSKLTCEGLVSRQIAVQLRRRMGFLDANINAVTWEEEAKELLGCFRDLGCEFATELVRHQIWSRQIELIGQKFVHAMDLEFWTGTLGEVGFISTISRLQLVDRMVNNERLDREELLGRYLDYLEKRIRIAQSTFLNGSEEQADAIMPWQIALAYYHGVRSVVESNAKHAENFFTELTRVFQLAEQAGIRGHRLDTLGVSVALPIELSRRGDEVGAALLSPVRVAECFRDDFNTVKATSHFLESVLEMFENEGALKRLPAMNRGIYRMCFALVSCLARSPIRTSSSSLSHYGNLGVRLVGIMLEQAASYLTVEQLESEDVSSGAQAWIEARDLIKKIEIIDGRFQIYSKDLLRRMVKVKRELNSAAQRVEIQLPEKIWKI